MATHVIPADELSGHLLRRDCPCVPVEDGRRVVHHSIEGAAAPSVDPEGRRLVEASARAPEHSWQSSTDPPEASAVEASRDEAEGDVTVDLNEGDAGGN